ncbi:bacterio-opsin activator domain-containing protein [Halorussus halophilus]|uniref:bacterio-opsin activator domain-containing protein n=1 Tax=Halorussus halophilus TaxID=2650975 RepID=UPI001787C31F|nr:bacterio-opsin activator domain-containing protein [Halorussus halophilus]
MGGVDQGDTTERPSGTVEVLYVGPDRDRGEQSVRALESVRPELSGHAVRTFERASTAVTNDHADCVVSEYSLPSSDGVELLRTVREERPGLPFILYTDSGDESVASEAVSAGVTEYFRRGDDTVDRSTLADCIVETTEDHRTERQRRRGHRALETAHEGICLLDDDGTITYSNPAYDDTYGYEKGELVGEQWETLYSPAESERIESEIVPKLKRDGVWSGETTGTRSDGTEFPEMHSITTTEDGGIACVVRDVSERNRRRRQLSEREDYLRKLYETTSDLQLSFDEKVERLLEIGCERFGLDVGFLSEIDAGGFEVRHAHGSHELLQAGETAQLSETYCRRTYGAPGPVEVSNATEEGWNGDVAHQKYGLESYLGVAVSVAGERFGTLCFADTSPQKSSFTDHEQTYLELMSEWVSAELERERRENRLAALAELTQDLMDDETHAQVCRTVVDSADTFGLSAVALALYDEDSASLRPTEATAVAAEHLPLDDLCRTGEGEAWQSVVEGEMRTIASDDDAVSEYSIVPLGDHGGLVVGAATQSFRETDLDFLRTMALNVESALDRAEREQLLHERESTLQERNESLERLNRINSIIRTIDQALVEASTRDEIHEVVCKHLANLDSYKLAWVGEYDGVNAEVEPVTWVGDGDEYVQSITITSDDSATGTGPAGTAIETGEPQVVDSVFRDSTLGPWRQAALAHGYHSIISIPLAYDGSTYGVMTVYGSETNTFGQLERDVLTELGETIAYAINSVEHKKALVADSVVELDFEITGPGVEILDLCSEHDCSFTYETAFRQSDGELRVYFSTTGADSDRVTEFAPNGAVSDITHLSTWEESSRSLFEAVLTDESLTATIFAHGGVPTTIEVDDDAIDLTVELPADGDARSFVAMLDDRLPNVELLAQREFERPHRTRNSFHAELDAELTDRQQEVLKTAHFSGYFQSPRNRTGEEIGRSLDISQPTFNNHLRVAQRKLFDLLFEHRATRL